MDTNFELYPGKTFQDVCKDIYSNHVQRKAQIESLIADLRKMCVKIDDLPMVIPFIKDYINALNVNDEHLIRFAGLIQKLIIAEEQTKVITGGTGLSEEERKMIMSEIGKEFDAIVEADQAMVKVLDNK